MPQITPFDFGEDVLNAGDTVSLICTVGKGDLPLKIHWLLNDQVLNSGNNILINRSGKRISLLSIENVQHEHIGNYTCIAENEAGLSSHSAVLNVNGIIKHFRLQITHASLLLNLFWLFLQTPLFNFYGLLPTSLKC